MHLYTHKFENLDAMDNFQVEYKIPNLTPLHSEIIKKLSIMEETNQK